MKKQVEEMNPSIIYVHLRFRDDVTMSKGYDQLTNCITEQMKQGRSCIIAHTRLNHRWKRIEKIYKKAYADAEGIPKIIAGK